MKSQNASHSRTSVLVFGPKHSVDLCHNRFNCRAYRKSWVVWTHCFLEEIIRASWNYEVSILARKIFSMTISRCTTNHLQAGLSSIADETTPWTSRLRVCARQKSSSDEELPKRRRKPRSVISEDGSSDGEWEPSVLWRSRETAGKRAESKNGSVRRGSYLTRRSPWALVLCVELKTFRLSFLNYKYEIWSSWSCLIIPGDQIENPLQNSYSIGLLRMSIFQELIHPDKSWPCDVCITYSSQLLHNKRPFLAVDCGLISRVELPPLFSCGADADSPCSNVLCHCQGRNSPQNARQGPLCRFSKFEWGAVPWITASDARDLYAPWILASSVSYYWIWIARYISSEGSTTLIMKTWS